MEFRELRRIKQAATPQECEAVLSAAQRGVLAVHGENGYPYGLPVNYLCLDGKIYFHCAKAGHKLDAVRANDKQEKDRLLRQIGAKYFPEGYDLEKDMAKNAPNALILGITIDHMSGKHVREK